MCCQTKVHARRRYTYVYLFWISISVLYNIMIVCATFLGQGAAGHPLQGQWNHSWHHTDWPVPLWRQHSKSYRLLSHATALNSAQLCSCIPSLQWSLSKRDLAPGRPLLHLHVDLFPSDSSKAVPPAEVVSLVACLFGLHSLTCRGTVHPSPRTARNLLDNWPSLDGDHYAMSEDHNSSE